MAKEPTREEINKFLFTNLVMMFGSAAMQQLGKLMNPMTGKVELDLDGAQSTIDMIQMLSDKTKGNLDEDEAKMLKQTLSSLQLNYVETASNPPPAAAADEKPAEPAEAAGKDAGTPAAKEEEEKPAKAPAADVKNAKDPKYHKKYE